MILAFDVISTGTHHVPFNTSMLQILARALPNQRIRMHGDDSHLAELRNDPLLAEDHRIEFRKIAISLLYPGKIQLVSPRRCWHELRTIAAAVRDVPPGEYCLLVLLVASASTMLAVRLLAAMRPRRLGAVICLHGNVVTLTQWRSRNPVIRLLDTWALLERRPAGSVRHLVFEEGIRRELGNLVPQALATTDVLPHPAYLTEVCCSSELALQYPVRIGLVGQATPGKGVDPFLETAKLFKEKYNGSVEFYLLGRVFPGDDVSRFACLDGPVSTEGLTRHDFRALLAKLHFVFLPLQPRYYRFAASGALLDAITWLKPVIATSLPIVADIFVRYGDVGYLCDDIEKMHQMLHSVLTKIDPRHYAAQVEAMRRVRQDRLPVALAQDFRTKLHSWFPKVPE
jgi:hypothetical protein